MGQVLYRKYRSKNLSEIVGQDPITTTLKNAINTGRISHAYLFTGPRGVGKTSVARILAHEINGLDYDLNQNHIDIIEIDAASNRRIDEIRDLRDKVHILPTQAKYKVYIIDEVHMLTKEAFNALLKTLEEPPEHVIFILATTDAHKVPPTIISRTQRFSFKPVSLDQVKEHLKKIADEENIKITEEALDLVAEHGEGSFRDSISLLDQLGSGGKEINVNQVLEILGMPPKEAVLSLIKGLETGQTSYLQIKADLENMTFQGISPKMISQSIMLQIRSDLLSGKLSGSRWITLLQKLLLVGGSSDPFNFLLVTLMAELPSPTSKEKIEVKPKPMPSAELTTAPKIVASIEKAAEPVSNSGITVAESSPEPIHSSSNEDQLDLETTWQELLDSLKKKYNTLYGIVRMSTPSVNANKLTLAFSFAFHQKRVSDAKNKKIISDIIYDITGQKMQIECILSDKKSRKAPVDKPKQDPQSKEALEDISSIFGGGELME